MSEPAILTTNTPWSMSPDVAGFAASESIEDALILQVSTRAGVIEGDEPTIRVPVVVAADAEIVAEGAEISEADPELSEVTLSTVKCATLLRVSREQWFSDSTSTMLAGSAQRSIIAKADSVFLTQEAPTPPATWPPPGLLAQGIPAGGTLAGDLDALVDAIAAIKDAGGDPSHVLLAPSSWATTQKYRVGEGSNQTLIGTAQSPASPLLLGLPVLTNAAVPAGTGLVLDASDVVSAYGDVMVAVSDQAAFRSDSVLVRITFRFGSRVVHPARHRTFTVTAPTAP